MIIPTHQRRELVRRAVASALAQTLTDFELLVIDDGSTDGTREALAGVDERIRYRWQENLGPAVARNLGLRMASAPIVAFLDSDDLWLPDHLETVTGALARHPEAVLTCTCPRKIIAGRQRPERARLVDPLPDTFFQQLAGFISCTAVRREPLLEIGGFDERLVVADDTDLFARLSLRGPFSLVRRRTVIKQRSSDSWGEEGRRRAAAMDDFDARVKSQIGEIEAIGGAAAASLAARGRAMLTLNAAIRAVAERDQERLSVALRDACGLDPELSRRPEITFVRIRASLPRVHEPEERLRAFAGMAEAWPERDSPTAITLRGAALMLAVRCGQLRRALGIARDWPARGTPAAIGASAVPALRWGQRRLARCGRNRAPRR